MFQLFFAFLLSTCTTTSLRESILWLQSDFFPVHFPKEVFAYRAEEADSFCWSNPVYERHFARQLQFDCIAQLIHSTNACKDCHSGIFFAVYQNTHEIVYYTYLNYYRYEESLYFSLTGSIYFNFLSLETLKCSNLFLQEINVCHTTVIIFEWY